MSLLRGLRGGWAGAGAVAVGALAAAGCFLVAAGGVVGRSSVSPPARTGGFDLLFAGGGGFGWRGAGLGGVGAMRRSGLGRSYGQVPLAFERNRGQSDRRVRYLARGAGYGLFLTDRGAVLSLRRGSGVPGKRGRGAVLSLAFAGAATHPLVVGSDRLAGTANYMVGSDRSRWRTGVPTFSRVGYRSLWRGIDAVYYGRRGSLEYDFRVAPGADPARIGLSFTGADVRVDRRGDLILGLLGARVRQRRPLAYQVIAGLRRVVASGYVLSHGRVGVRVGSYDRRFPLVVDPVLSYSTYLGGSGDDVGNGIAVDSAGSAYVTGTTTSAKFPIAGALQSTSSGNEDAFVAKLNPAGSALSYSTYLGGSNLDRAFGVAVDSAGSAYVTGFAGSTDFPTAGALQSTNPHGNDAFVAKLNPAGSALSYSTYLGGSSLDWGYGVAVDSAGSAYVTGSTRSANFPTAGALQRTSGGDADAFVAKLNPAGSALTYSTYLGGSTLDEGRGVAVDSAGSAYVTGTTGSTNFPTAGALQRANGGGSGDAFVAKLNPAGSALTYSTYLGGSTLDWGRGVAVDSAGSAYVTGSTDSDDFPTARALQRTNGGGNDDAFVAKLNPAGSALPYSTYLGGSNGDTGRGIAVDSAGSAYVTGRTGSPNFPTAGAPQRKNGGGSGDAFVAKLNPAGSALPYSTYLGGSNIDAGNAIAVDTAGSAYVTGLTTSANFPTADALQPTNGGGGNYDAFVAKLTGRGDETAPRVSNYKITNKKGTTLKYTLSEAATVKIAIAQRRSGRRNGKRCVAPTRKLRNAKKCNRLFRKGTLTRTSHRGANKVAFSGRVRSKALKPGLYQATLTATDKARNTSKPKTIFFTIAKR